MTRDALQQAQEAFRAWKGSQSLEALEQVLREGGPPNDAAAHLLKGMIYEFGGEGVSIDLSKAVESYRTASHLIGNSDSIPFLYLARALMKQGPGSYAAALNYIQQASTARHTAEVDLAFAAYYEADEGSLNLAKRHYLKAAAKGRFAGFFGLASMLRKGGHNLQAIIVDGVRILAGPILFVLLGKTARSSFIGY